MLRFAAILALSVLAAGAPGCQSVAVPAPAGGVRAGHLVVAGGATKADNTEVYSRFMAPLAAGAVIGVVPTASASTAESAASAAGTLARHAGGRRIETIDITASNSGAADPSVVAQIERCAALWFTGGDQSRIISAFRPEGGDAPGYAAAVRVLERGGVIGGTSAGAAMMCDPMITGGRSDDALAGKFRAEGDDAGFGIGRGMGFFPFGLVDQHFLRRGRLGRLVVALERTGRSRGYGVEENCALDVDITAGTITVLGPVPGAAVLVDVSRARRDGGARSGVRVSLLCSGDRVDAQTGRVTPANERRPVRSAGADAAAGDAPVEAWSAGAVTGALHRLAAKPAEPVEMHSDRFTVRFAADADTRFYQAASADRLTVIDAVFEIHPRRSAEPEPKP